MEDPNANPAATYWTNVVADAAIETMVAPSTVFADVQISGTISGSPTTMDTTEATTTTAAPSVSATAGAGIDQQWLTILAVVVLAIAVVAVVSSQNRR